MSRKPEYVFRDIENNRLKVYKKLLINLNYFNLESFSDDRLFDTDGESFIINAIINKGTPLIIYILKNSLKNKDENDKRLGIYINNLVDRVYVNSFIIINIREVIKSGIRWPKYLKKKFKIPFIEYYIVNNRVIFRDRFVILLNNNKI